MGDRFERTERRAAQDQLISIEDAERVKAIVTSVMKQPGVGRYISRSSGAEHHVAYATALLPDMTTSMGPNVPELFIQTLLEPLREGETTEESWRALVSILTYSEQFSNYSSRQVYDVNASNGRVIDATRRVYSVYGAQKKTFQTLVDELVDDCIPEDADTRRTLMETTMTSEHIDQLSAKVASGLARVAVTSFRIPSGTFPAKVRRDVGVVNKGEFDNDPRYPVLDPQYDYLNYPEKDCDEARQ